MPNSNNSCTYDRYKSMFPVCENISQLKAWRREIRGDEKVNMYTCKYNESLTTTL